MIIKKELFKAFLFYIYTVREKWPFIILYLILTSLFAALMFILLLVVYYNQLAFSASEIPDFFDPSTSWISDWKLASKSLTRAQVPCLLGLLCTESNLSRNIVQAVKGCEHLEAFDVENDKAWAPDKFQIILNPSSLSVLRDLVKISPKSPQITRYRTHYPRVFLGIHITEDDLIEYVIDKSFLKKYPLMLPSLQMQLTFWMRGISTSSRGTGSSLLSKLLARSYVKSNESISLSKTSYEFTHLYDVICGRYSLSLFILYASVVLLYMFAIEYRHRHSISSFFPLRPIVLCAFFAFFLIPALFLFFHATMALWMVVFVEPEWISMAIIIINSTLAVYFLHCISAIMLLCITSTLFPSILPVLSSILIVIYTLIHAVVSNIGFELEYINILLSSLILYVYFMKTAVVQLLDYSDSSFCCYPAIKPCEFTIFFDPQKYYRQLKDDSLRPFLYIFDAHSKIQVVLKADDLLVEFPTLSLNQICGLFVGSLSLSASDQAALQQFDLTPWKATLNCLSYSRCSRFASWISAKSLSEHDVLITDSVNSMPILYPSVQSLIYYCTSLELLHGSLLRSFNKFYLVIDKERTKAISLSEFQKSYLHDDCLVLEVIKSDTRIESEEDAFDNGKCLGAHSFDAVTRTAGPLAGDSLRSISSYVKFHLPLSIQMPKCFNSGHKILFWVDKGSSLKLFLADQRHALHEHGFDLVSRFPIEREYLWRTLLYESCMDNLNC